ncbi:hypothetical protein ACGFYV_11850 [Streptomyces sp. NPDC048297]|uniref:hypothetical protein n=1 Tax=Streptomyces sp. NPDC048297 TaxID=3365531 RepID=UPI00371ADA13
MRWAAARARAALLGAVALCAVAALPGATAVAGTAGQETYAFAPDARPVTGTTGTAGAPRLEPGRTYRGSLPGSGVLYYRLDLDASDTAYVPVTAVPPAGTPVSATDGVRVSVQDARGTPCSYGSAFFGAGLSARPVTALGQRETGRTLCRGAGTYYLRVERRDAEVSAAAPPAPRWDLEITPVTEPGPAKAGATTPPGAWDSASPEPLAGEPRDRSGGTGFATARALGQGVWSTRIAPGQTLFYKVPVDWGRRLQATAELAGAPGHGYVGGALNLTLHNPVRGYVDAASLGYTGAPKSASLDPVPPVEYANRYAAVARVGAVRFAGEYYLVLHLSSQMSGTFGQGPFGVTLRVRLDGQAHAGPDYAGSPVPGDVFTISARDRAEALTGGVGGIGGVGSAGGYGGAGSVDGSDGGGTTMTALAVGGIGTGTALLLLLAVWTLTARRTQTRASAQKPTA